MFVQNKQILKIQVIPQKGNHTPIKLERKKQNKNKNKEKNKKKPYEVTQKLSFI